MDKLEILSSYEMSKIAEAIINANREIDSQSDISDQIHRIINWAIKARVDFGLVELILKGDIQPYINNDGLISFLKEDNEDWWDNGQEHYPTIDKQD